MKKKLNKIAKDINNFLKKYLKSQKKTDLIVPIEGKIIDEQEIVSYCRDRLSSFKKPESVVVVQELPRNPLGKVLKTVLREQYGSPES